MYKLPQLDENRVGALRLAIGMKKFFNLEEAREAWNLEVGTHRMYIIMRDLKWKLDRSGNPVVLQSFRGKGYRLWPRKELGRGERT